MDEELSDLCEALRLAGFNIPESVTDVHELCIAVESNPPRGNRPKPPAKSEADDEEGSGTAWHDPNGGIGMSTLHLDGYGRRPVKPTASELACVARQAELAKGYSVTKPPR